MRIATSQIFDQQTASIDNLSALQQQQGNELSSGKRLNKPSDDPTHIAQDLSLRTQIAQGNQTGDNVANLSAELTTVDGALSSVTDVLQQARALAVSGASDALTPSQRQAMATQVDGLLGELVGLGNTQYAGKYVFGGTADLTQAPVKPGGTPTSNVTFSGNLQSQTQVLPSGQSVPSSVTIQQAFNFSSTNGSPDAFQTLISLRNALAQGTVADVSQSGVNVPGTSLAAATPINTAGILATPLVADANGNVDVSISSGTAPNGVTIAIPANATVAGVLAAINAQTGTTGVTASFDYAQQKLSLSSAGGAPFQIADVVSPGAPTPGNFTTAFGLTQQADVTNTVSAQLGNIDQVLQVALQARTTVGQTIQNLSTVASLQSSQVLNNTAVQSGIEDADIAKVMTAFSQTQTALQAAYGTTTKLESKSLFDYLG